MNEMDCLMLQSLFRSRSISKAARELYVSQPSLSIRLSNLEKELQATLVNRGSKGIEFTEQGIFAVQEAQKILHQIRQMKDGILNLSEGIRGTITLGAGNYTALHILPKILVDFRDRFPDIRFEIIDTKSREINALLFDQDIHIGFVTTLYGWTEEKLLLYEEPLYLINKEPIAIEELSHRDYVHYNTDPEVVASIQNWWQENVKQSQSKMHIVPNIESCKKMVQAGLGVGIIPKTALEKTSTCYYTHLLHGENGEVKRKNWVVYRSNIKDIQHIGAFIQHLEEVAVSLKEGNEG